MTVSPTHKEWDDKSKAVAWHEYFHNSVVGKGVYKAMPCEKTVKTFFKSQVKQYYQSLTNIDSLDVLLNDYITNYQKKGILPNSPDNTIYCTIALDACKISDPSTKNISENDYEECSQLVKDELIEIKKQLKNQIDIIDTKELSIVQQLIFMKIIKNSISNTVGCIFNIKENQHSLLTLVKEICPKLPRTKKIKSEKSNLIQQKINKQNYINLLIENDNFINIKSYPPNYASNESSDNQLFAFAILPHDIRMHSIIIHLSSSADGHVHDLELNKIIKILGKLQEFNFSPIFICADGETGLSKYHVEYFRKFIEPYIDRIMDPNDEMTILDLLHLIFQNVPHCPPIPILDILHACKSSRTRLINGNVFFNKFIPPILQEEIQMILDLGSTITDMSTIGKMKDFYAINLFKFENVFKSFESENHELTLYILIYTLVLESFRNPKINMQTRIDF